MILGQIDEKINEKIKTIQDKEKEIKDKENEIKQILRGIDKINNKIEDCDREIRRLIRQIENDLTKQQNNRNKSLIASQNPFLRLFNTIFSKLAPKPKEQQEESETVDIEKYEEEIKRINSNIDEYYKNIETNYEKKSNIEKDIKKLQEEIQQMPSEIIQLNEREKENRNTQRKKPVYLRDRGIESFSELEQILGDILIDTKDLDVLKKDYQSYGGDYKEYYIFKACDSIENLFLSYEKVYDINTEDLPKTSQVALIVPMNEVESKDLVAFDSNRIIVSNKFSYPNGTICMVPAGYGIKIKKELKNNVKTSNVTVIEYEGNEIGDYPRCLVKLLEGNDPKKWNRDIFIKKYSYLKEIKDNYFDEQAINNIIQLVKRIEGHKFDTLPEFLNYLKELENEGLGTEAIFKQALFGEEKDIEEEVKYLIKKIQDNGYCLSDEGNKLILDLFGNQIKFSKKGYEQIEENSLYNNVYRFIVSKSIDKFLKGEISKDDTYKYILMSVIATDNKALNIEKQANDYYDKKAKTNARRMERDNNRREQHEKEEEKKEARPKKKRKVRTPITTTKVELYYDDSYILDFNNFFKQINDILNGYETEENLNSALRDGTVIYLNTADDVERLEEASIRSSELNVGYGNNIPLKKRINIQELLEKKEYVPKGESAVVSLLRLTHVCNRLAHRYQLNIDNYIYDYFYGENENESIKPEEIKKTEDFKRLENKVKEVSLKIKEFKNTNTKKYTIRSGSLYGDNVDKALDDLNNILEKMGITKKTDFNFFESVQQLVDLRGKCYESKAKLINCALRKIREEKKETGLTRGIHSYGKMSKIDPNTGQTENFIIFNLYKYGQIAFHIIDEELWKSISQSYEEWNLPIIKQTNVTKNIMTSPVLTGEISDELKGYIERRGKNNLIRQIARNCKTTEERRIELYKVMLVCGESPKEIDEVLRLYDSGR